MISTHLSLHFFSRELPSDNFAIVLDVDAGVMYYTVNTNVMSLFLLSFPPPLYEPHLLHLPPSPQTTQRVYTSNLDGTGVVLLANVASSVRGIVCHGSKLYVAQPSGRQIIVMNKVRLVLLQRLPLSLTHTTFSSPLFPQDGSDQTTLASHSTMSPYMLDVYTTLSGDRLLISDVSGRTLWR